MDILFNLSQNFIVVKDLSTLVDFTAIEDEWNKLTWTKNINNLISDEMNFFDKQVFINSKNIIEDECKKYLDNIFLLKDYYTDLKLTRSWGNITNPGAMHHEHKHPFSIVSGVIYLDDNPSNLNLYIESYFPEIPYFISKSTSYAALKHLIADMNISDKEHKNLKHHMVLFLSNKSHFVESDTTTTLNRRSLSFNTFWKGNTGVKTSALGSLDF